MVLRIPSETPWWAQGSSDPGLPGQLQGLEKLELMVLYLRDVCLEPWFPHLLNGVKAAMT